jgi:SAM-dependent methyltransferase
MLMNTIEAASADQAALWNGAAGSAWVDAQQVLDTMLQPFEDLLVERLGKRPGARVLDVGCGTGSTTLAFARRAGAGRCTGVDISEPMLALAQARAAREGVPARFIRADAQTYPFERASFDAVASRFGVMFFVDPAQAFGNLRAAARDGAALHFVAWRAAAENPFMTAAERAAGPLLPALPARLPNAPGQFAFADAKRVESILAGAGWGEVSIRPLDLECSFPAHALDLYLSRLGPVGVLLQSADADTRARVTAALRDAFAPYVRGTEVRFATACWSIDAVAA